MTRKDTAPAISPFAFLKRNIIRGNTRKTLRTLAINILLLSLLPTGETAFSQTPVIAQQWHTQVTSKNVTASYDWIFDILQTPDKEYLAVGYARYKPPTGNEFTAPVFLKLDHKGEVLWVKYVLSTTGLNLSGPDTLINKVGHLWSIGTFIQNNTTRYLAAGFIKDSSGADANLLVEFDDQGTINHSIAFRPICPAGDIAANMSIISSKARALAVDTATNDILITGEASFVDNQSIKHRFLHLCKVPYQALVTKSLSTADYRILGNDGGSRNDYRGGNGSFSIITRPATGSGYEIYIAGFKSSTQTTDEDNQKFTGETCTPNVYRDVWKLNKDIWLLKMNENLSIIYDKTYTKSDLPAIQYNNTGPLTARDLDLATPQTAVNCVPTFVKSALKASVNTDERGEDITFSSDGNLAMVASVNRLSIGLGRPDFFHDDNGSDYISGTSGITAMRNGSPFDYYFYKDADLYLLRINAATGNLMQSGGNPLSKNVGHFSSREFQPKIIQNCNDAFIIAGSTADYYTSADPDLTTPNKYDLFIVSTDDNTGTTLWRRNLHSEGEGAVCNFALAKTADDGFITGGDNDINDDDFSITKFAPPYTANMSYSGNDIVGINGIYTLATDETWNSSRKVKAKVIIPQGKTLTITGNSTIISFASSDHIYDFTQFDYNGNDNIKIGIVVEPGGILDIKNGATLRGIAYTPCSASLTNN